MYKRYYVFLYLSFCIRQLPKNKAKTKNVRIQYLDKYIYMKIEIAI